MKIRYNIITAIIVVVMVVGMCFVYWKVTTTHNKDIGEMMEEQYYYLIPNDSKPEHVKTFHTPQIGEEVYKNGNYYVIERIIYNMDSNNLNVHCRKVEK
jgi:hypothetical protein